MAKLNPIKWSTERLQQFLHQIEKTSKIPRHSPFYMNDVNFLDANLNFGYTEEELTEMAKCQQDVIYFAENYCYVKTEKGRQKISFEGGRKYQKKVLKAYRDWNFNVFLASRQIGKSLSPLSKVNIATYTPIRYTLSIPMFELLYAVKFHNGRATRYDKIRTKLYRAILMLQDEDYSRDRRVIRAFCDRKDFFL